MLLRTRKNALRGTIPEAGYIYASDAIIGFRRRHIDGALREELLAGYDAVQALMFSAL